MVKTNLPVLILKNIILFPYSEIRLEIEEDKEKELISLAMSYYNKHILIVNQSNALEEDIDINDLPKIGVIGYIEMKIDLPNKKTKIVVRGISRVEIEKYTQEDELVNALITEIPLEKLDYLEEMAYSRSLIKQMEHYIELNPNMSDGVLSQIMNVNDLDKLTDILCIDIPGSYERKLEYLYEYNSTIRVTMIIEDITQELKIIELESKLGEKINKRFEKSQKEYFLNEKIKAIKEELGESFDKDQETNELKKQVKDLKCEPKIKDRLNLEIKRYQNLQLSSPEVGTIRNYIDWLLTLPWKKSTVDSNNLKQVKESLDQTHYGLEEVKERIIEYIATQQMTKGDNSPIICLVGPPGVGKTSLGKSIAIALNRKYAKISVGGINDESEIIGHRRTYIGAAPGRIIQGLKRAGSNNPVFMIDEIDKMCHDIKGDPASALLEILDKEQNKTFSDNYIEEEFDLSKVMFICTANYDNQIPSELADRLEMIQISSYTEYEKLNIVKKHVIPKGIESHGLKKDQIIFDDEAILKIIRNYTKEAGIRELERMISSILRKVVKDILIENNLEKKFIINEKEINKYLGKEKYFYNKNKNKSQIGVVNGMSYTIYGGDILPIEVNYFKGKGEIILTGRLGEVFIESAKIALSYIKSISKELNIDYSLLENNDIHIHVPEGAIKKDGPSAGAAITLAIISALTNKKISSNISITGEITLRGEILPIGGLKEKIIGAKRAGITKIFIPKENERDLEEIDKEIKEDIKFVLISNFTEIMKEILK